MVVKKLILNHAPFGQEKIDVQEFENFDEHIGKSNFWQTLHAITVGRIGVVWLVSFKDEVYVTDSILNLHVFTEMINAFDLDMEEVDVFIQEYSSFEAAYEVALMMQEIKPLCYET